MLLKCRAFSLQDALKWTLFFWDCSQSGRTASLIQSRWLGPGLGRDKVLLQRRACLIPLWRWCSRHDKFWGFGEGDNATILKSINTKI